MKKAVIYIHGKGGSADEAEHYTSLFPDCSVIGFDYHSSVPWDAVTEFRSYFEALKKDYDSVEVIANSIGAYFVLAAGSCLEYSSAYLISPIVNMELLITGMMSMAGVSESELIAKGTIEANFGDTLSWQYLSWVREHPVAAHTPLSILYGSRDTLQPREIIAAFAVENGSELTVMENGEHWFHTEEQMAFLDTWILDRRKAAEY